MRRRVRNTGVIPPSFDDHSAKYLVVTHGLAMLMELRLSTFNRLPSDTLCWQENPKRSGLYFAGQLGV